MTRLTRKRHDAKFFLYAALVAGIYGMLLELGKAVFYRR